MTERLTLRDARIEDAAMLTRIAVAAKSHWGYSNELMQLWRPQLTISPQSIDRGIVTVAELDGNGIGFSGLDIEASPPEIDDLWVLPDFQHRGIGRLLFEHVCQSARHRGFDKIVIVSDPNAAGFYERMGASQIGWHPSTPTGRKLPKFLLQVDDRVDA